MLNFVSEPNKRGKKEEEEKTLATVVYFLSRLTGPFGFAGALAAPLRAAGNIAFIGDAHAQDAGGSAPLQG